MKIGELLIEGYNVLKDAEIDSYMIDCQLLLAKALNTDRLAIITNRDKEVSVDEMNEFRSFIELRGHNMPVKYITGTCEFMGIELQVKEGVLIPRGDTEVLVEEAIKDIMEKKLVDICDLCCGSGAVGIAIAKFTENTKVTSYDISEIALEVTANNIASLELGNRMQVICSDLLEKAVEEEKRFDVIASNPPYISSEVIPTLMKDVREYEPYIALCGGEYGLDFYRRIVKQSVKVLNPGGSLIFEIGHDQAMAVSDMLISAGFDKVVCVKDLAGHDRVVKGILI